MEMAEAAEKEDLDVSVEKTQPEDCNPEAKEKIQDIIVVFCSLLCNCCCSQIVHLFLGFKEDGLP